MTYYLVILDNDISYEIGNATLGGTLLAEIGWTLLKRIIENYENINFTFKIVDETSKKYSLNQFLKIIEKNKIIEQNEG